MATLSIKPHWEPWKRVRLPGTLRESKRALGERSISLYGSSVRETWREGPFTGNSEARSYQYPETGSETEFGPYFDSKTRLLSFNMTQSRVVLVSFLEITS